jgi:Holliday junction resolvasome RuvABC DNA-binding subunit
MDSQRHQLRLTVEHAGSKFAFFVLEKDADATIKQVVATESADTLQEAVDVAEESAQEYLADDNKKVTVPFWIEVSI